MTKRILLSLGLLAAVPTAFAGDDPPPKSTKSTATATAADPAAVTDTEAAEDDILLVLGLPMAAADARDAGVDAAEVGAAIDATAAAGGSPGEVTRALVAEAAATRKRGPKKGFGAWVGLQLSEGKRGKELADLIAKKKAEYAEMSDAQKAEVDKQLAALHDAWVDKRKAIHARRKELVAAGKKMHRVGEAELKALEKAQSKNDKRQKRLDDAIAADPARKGELESLMKRVEKREDKLERREDKVEDRQAKIEDAADKAEDRKDARDDRKDGRDDHEDDHGKGHGGKKHEGKGG